MMLQASLQEDTNQSCQFQVLRLPLHRRRGIMYSSFAQTRDLHYITAFEMRQCLSKKVEMLSVPIL